MSGVQGERGEPEGAAGHHRAGQGEAGRPPSVPAQQSTLTPSNIESSQSIVFCLFNK